MADFRSKLNVSILASALVLSGCTATLVRDDVKRTAGLIGHCIGSEWLDNSSVAVLPVRLVAFLTPHVDLHQLSSEPSVSLSGASTQVVADEPGTRGVGETRQSGIRSISNNFLMRT